MEREQEREIERRETHRKRERERERENFSSSMNTIEENRQISVASSLTAREISSTLTN